MSLNASILVAPLVDFVTGKIIEANANNVPATLVSRAQEIIALNAAVTAINNGDPNGLAALQSALVTTALSPGESLALASLTASLGKQVALIGSIEGGTILGSVVTAQVTAILATGTAVAQAYVAKYSTPAPATPAT